MTKKPHSSTKIIIVFAVISIFTCACNYDLLMSYIQKISAAIEEWGFESTTQGLDTHTPEGEEATLPANINRGTLEFGQTDEGSEGKQEAEEISEEAPMPSPSHSVSDDKEADFKFSLADCSCSGIQIPLDEEASSFHNNPDATYSPKYSEKKINATNHLFCKWKQDYQSEELTSNIEIKLDAFVVRGNTQAEDLVNTLSYEILEKKGYCEDDDMCTVAMDSFSPPESLHYIEEWVWKPYGEDALPSDHWAHVTGFVRGKDRHLVYSIMVNHPERNPGDPWAKNNAYALEKCINTIWSSYQKMH